MLGYACFQQDFRFSKCKYSIDLTELEYLFAGFGNFSAVLLFPLLMNYFGLGVTGAAISTVVSQYVLFTVLHFLLLPLQ
jgi:Na+-driven multidrug efflux pump